MPLTNNRATIITPNMYNTRFITCTFSMQRYEKYFVQTNKSFFFAFFCTKILPFRKKAVPLHAFSTSEVTCYDVERAHIVPLAIALG
jgi:hypothetical protein